MAHNLFNGNGNPDDDIWDDTELVQHFDKAIELSRKLRGPGVLEADPPGPWQPLHEGERELGNLENDYKSKPLVLNSENSNTSISSSLGDTSMSMSDWKTGSNCRAVFSEDNVEYEAKITEILETTCIIRFVGYGNEEEVNLADLKPSLGKKKRDLQRIQALQLLDTPEENSNQNNDPDHEEPNTAAITSEENAPGSGLAATADPNDQIPPEYEKLRERVRHVIESKFNACAPKVEAENFFENPYSTNTGTGKYRGKRLQQRKRSQQSPATGAGTSGGMNGFVAPANTYANDWSAPTPVVQEPSQLQQPPMQFKQEWMQAFPNLLTPPMPNSFLSPDGSCSYGKGELPSLLMTWYMAGYHSGAFDAKQDMRRKMTEANRARK